MAIEFGSRKETFENFKVYETTLAGRPFKVEMGKMCGLSNASALIRYGETCVLCNVVMSPKPREGVDFFPLNVEYEEKLYAAGRIPGSFMRREGRPGERAILTSRVVDRPMRPLFPKEMRNDVCITMTVMSLDPDCSPEIAGMIGASLVTAVSEIPWNGPIGGVQVGLVDGEIVLNPTQEQRKVSDLALTVAATMDKIVMIEAGANEVDEDTMLNAIKAAHVEIKKIITEITEKSKLVESTMQENEVLQTEQQEAINRTEEIFGEIMKQIEMLGSGMERINALNDTMSANKDLVVDKMGTIASVSEQSAAATEEVNASTEQVNVTMEEISEHTETLQAIAKDLMETINRFKLA